MPAVAPRFDPDAFRARLTTSAVGRLLVYRDEVASTMDIGRDLAAAGTPHGSLILAERQTAGRGRRGRSFHSPEDGNLYVTLVLRCVPSIHRLLPIAVPLAVCDAIRAEGLDARIKWPNDIWAGGRKLCGMLIDAEASDAGLLALVGIGINVNGDPRSAPGLADSATSIRIATGRHIAREELLARICNRLEAAMEIGLDEIVSQYRKLSLLIGREISVVEAGGSRYDARATGIAPDGSLVVQREDGAECSLTAAEVSVRPVPGAATAG